MSFCSRAAAWELLHGLEGVDLQLEVLEVWSAYHTLSVRILWIFYSFHSFHTLFPVFFVVPSSITSSTPLPPPYTATASLV